MTVVRNQQKPSRTDLGFRLRAKTLFFCRYAFVQLITLHNATPTPYANVIASLVFPTATKGCFHSGTLDPRSQLFFWSPDWGKTGF